MKKNVAIFPLSADPPTRGHLNIIRRASALFETLHVVIFENAQKKYLLEVGERIQLLKECLNGIENLVFDQNEGLLNDYCAHMGINIIIRSLRGGSDLDYERDLEQGIKRLDSSLEFLYLLAEPPLIGVSSTMAKNLLHQSAFTHDYLPLNVKEFLEKKSERYLVGYTGSIATGKSTIGLKLEDELRRLGHEAYYLDLDKIVHQIQTFSTYPSLREAFELNFGRGVIADNGSLDRKALLAILHEKNDPKLWRLITELLRPAIISEIQLFLKTRKGFFFLDGTVLLENGMLPIVNNNLILIDCDKKLQMKRLIERDKISEEMALKKIRQAGSFETKKELYLNREEKYGKLWELKNGEGNIQKNLETLSQELIEHFKGH